MSNNQVNFCPLFLCAQVGIDFDQNPPRTADGKDATRQYATDRGIVHNPRESDEHKQAATNEMHAFEEAERRTAEGYRGTIFNPNRPDHVKLGVAEKLANLPHFSEETRTERREEAERLGLQRGQQ
ncbi:hypothetical protein JCM11641_005999 [Rhodosporidiobolus odoratus]